LSDDLRSSLECGDLDVPNNHNPRAENRPNGDTNCPPTSHVDGK